MPFHSDVTMETINDIFPPLDPPIGPDLESNSFIGMTNGILESSFPPLSPSSNMADSMLDDNDDLNTLALGDHPFMELTSSIHIKQEYEDEEEDTSYHGNHNNPSAPAAAATAKSGQPSMIRGLLDQPANVIHRHLNGVSGLNGLGGALTNGHSTSPLQQVYSNTDIHQLLNGSKIKVEPKEEVSEEENVEESDDDEDDEDEAEIDEDGDTTGGSTISSVVSSTMSSAVSSAAATPVVSPAQSPAPVITPQPPIQPTPPPTPTTTTTTTAAAPPPPPVSTGQARGGQHAAAAAAASSAATAAATQSAGWTSGREKRSNRWASNTPANYGKVEKKELRKRKPTSYALLREDPLPSKKKRSYNFRQFRRTIEMSFSSEGEKQEFDESLECLKQWANMKTVTQFLQFAMKQLQELRAQGQAFISEPVHKTKSKKKVKKYPAEQAISSSDSEDIEVFATCVPSLQHLVNQAHDIGARGLPSPRINLTRRDIHTGIFSLDNSEESVTWHSSPTLHNTSSFLVNYRLAVGMLCSGISTQKYDRFSQAAKFGDIKSSFMEEKCMPGVSAAVGKAVQESTDRAVADVCLRCPSGTEVETHCETSIVSDKRHTTVLAMDTDSHKILGSVIITKNEDPAAKQNDTKDDDVIGSQKLLRNLIDKGVVIRSSKTSNGMNQGKAVTNGNSTAAPVDEHMIWKAIRDDLKNYASITSGLQKDMARTWHPELADKEDGIRKQLYRSLRYSNGDSNLLRRGLCSIPRHYQGSHDLCHITSPCRQLANQNASYDRIKDIKALQILTVFIQQTNLYRYPSMIIEHIKSTSHRQPPKVSLKTFCGDGVSVSIPIYNLRTGLFVLWWNENSQIQGSQSQTSLENVPTTCHYAHDIWKKFLAKIS